MISRSNRFFPALLALMSLLVTKPMAHADVDRPVEDAAKFKLQVKADKSLPTLYLVGDSTMKVGTPGQRGWGDEMAKFFNPKKLNVVNQAIGGRSSRTFQTEGRWAAVVELLRKGDVVIIEFGHNDYGPINEAPPVTPATRSRGTIRGVGEETVEIDNTLTGKHEVVHSYGWYIRKYVNDTRAKGAVPIVMSPVPRNSWQNGKVNRAAPNGYGEWARLAAEETGCRFVDHNEIIAQALEMLGPEETGRLFADGKLHASPAGAEFNARAAIAGLKALPGNPFRRWFSRAARQIAPFNAGS